VLDFPFPDHGGLDLSVDDMMLERLYCFEDHGDDTHLHLGRHRRRVILKVHTLRKWKEREIKLYERVCKVTAVKVMYAYWNPSTRMFEMERQSELTLLPVSKQQQHTWRNAYRQKRYDELEWEWRKAGSMPSGDPDTGDGKVMEVYDEVRAAIKLGEGIFHRGATDKPDHHSGWNKIYGVLQVLPHFSPSLSPSLSLSPWQETLGNLPDLSFSGLSFSPPPRPPPLSSPPPPPSPSLSHTAPHSLVSINFYFSSET